MDCNYPVLDRCAVNLNDLSELVESSNERSYGILCGGQTNNGR